MTLDGQQKRDRPGNTWKLTVGQFQTALTYNEGMEVTLTPDIKQFSSTGA